MFQTIALLGLLLGTLVAFYGIYLNTFSQDNRLYDYSGIVIFIIGGLWALSGFGVLCYRAIWGIINCGW